VQLLLVWAILFAHKSVHLQRFKPLLFMRIRHWVTRSVFLLLGICIWGGFAFADTASPAETAPPAVPPAAPSEPAVPAAPKGLAMTANSADSITLEWYRSPNNEATSYTIYSSDKADGTFTRLGTSKERTFTHHDLKPGTTNYYKVSATNAVGESPPSGATLGFTITPCAGAPFPVKVATNMCLSLGATIVCDEKPISGKLDNLVDGSDATNCRMRKNCEFRIKLNDTPSIADAEYLLINFRTDCADVEWSNNREARTLSDYTITESDDSTDGKDGTWKEVLQGHNNNLLDGVIMVPNHKPKWIGIKSSGTDDAKDKEDRRPMFSDLILARLDIFRSAPAGFRNDYWIFVGDSLMGQDMPASSAPTRTSLFSDLVHKQHPDRYPIVVHAARGGEMLKDTLPRMKETLPALCPDSGTAVPVGTIIVWETGYNDVGVGGSLEFGAGMIKSYQAALDLCQSYHLIMVPVRIEYSLQYLNPDTLEPTNGAFVNSLAINLAGVDVFCRNFTPYAYDPATQLPFADYWHYTKANYAAALVKDGVHHTPAGSDGINNLWLQVADKMVYGPPKP